MRNISRMPKRPLGRRKSYLPKSKSLLVETAQASIILNGLQKSTVREIARKSDTSATMVYYHFGGKQGIVCAVTNLACNALINELSTAWETSPDDTSLENKSNSIISILYRHLDPSSFLGCLLRDPSIRKYKQVINILNEANKDILNSLKDIAYPNNNEANDNEFMAIENIYNSLFVNNYLHSRHLDNNFHHAS